MQNTQELYKAFKQKQSLGAPVDKRDLVVRMANEEDSLFDFIATNDLTQLNAIMHVSDAPFYIGQNATFFPSKTRILAELKQLLIRKDFKTINDILGAFKVNRKSGNYTSDFEILRQMELINLIGHDKDGNYKFKTVIS